MENNSIKDGLNYDVKLQKLRKAESMLAINGTGVLLFGIWSFSKMVLSMYLYKDTLRQTVIQGRNFNHPNFLFYTVIIVILIPFGIMTLIRLNISRNANAEANGIVLEKKKSAKKKKKKKKSHYLFWAGVLFLTTGTSLALTIYSFTSSEDYLSSAVSILADITSILTTGYLIRSALTVRKLRKEIGG